MLAPGVDVKGDGGFVVAPPSMRSDGTYRWLNDVEPVNAPEWLIALVTASARASGSGGSATGDRQAPIERVTAAVAVIPNPDLGWDDWCRIGMAIFAATGGSDQGLAIFDALSAKSAKHSEENTAIKWEQFHSSPPNDIGMGILVHLAREAQPGWEALIGLSMAHAIEVARLAALPPIQYEQQRVEAQGRLGISRIGALDDIVRRLRGSEDAERQSQIDILLEIAIASAEMFHTPDGTGYCDVDVDGHRETWAIKSRSYSRWLARCYYEQTRGAPSSEALRATLNVIEARAAFDGAERAVYVRIGGLDGRIYLDLVDDAWRAIEIDADGWRLVDRPPVRFRRSPGMARLPTPTRGGSVRALRGLLNVSTDADFTLAIAWVLAALCNGGPYPVAAIAGEHGTAKSTFAEILRRLIDPNTTPLRALPREERDLFISATNSHVLAFDNISGMPHWISDALCRLATGGGFATRELFADLSEVIIDATRPIIINGIEDIVTRADLADRTIMFTLEPIKDEKRRTEKDIWDAFDAAHAAVLGALLDAIAHGIGALPDVELEELPRMADFAKWVTACEGALKLPCRFEEAYMINLDQATGTVIDADLVADAVRTHMKDQKEWTGTATELLDALEGHVTYTIIRSRGWPHGPHILSRRLRRAATFLRKIGIEIELGGREGSARNRKITIRKPEPEPL